MILKWIWCRKVNAFLGLHFFPTRIGAKGLIVAARPLAISRSVFKSSEFALIVESWKEKEEVEDGSSMEYDTVGG